MRCRFLWIGVFLLFCSLCSVAQHDSIAKTDTLKFDSYYIYSGILDARDEAVAPFHWKGTQWITFGVLATAESGLMFAGGDKSIQQWAQRNRNSTTNFIENNLGDPFGDGLYPAILIGSSYIFGSVFHNNHLKKMALMTAKTIAISALTTTIIKSIAERDRPFQDKPPNSLKWNGPVGLFSNNSFPSGHTTVAFATATGIALAYPHPLIIPILAYGLASVTAFGRINGNFHWGSDVLMGAAIGYFTSRLVFTHNNWSKSRHKTKYI